MVEQGSYESQVMGSSPIMCTIDANAVFGVQPHIPFHVVPQERAKLHLAERDCRVDAVGSNGVQCVAWSGEQSVPLNVHPSGHIDILIGSNEATTCGLSTSL